MYVHIIVLIPNIVLPELLFAWSVNLANQDIQEFRLRF